MNTSDNVIVQPIELGGADLDAVSAGAMEPVTRSPLKVLETDVLKLVETILSDLGGPSKAAY